jgi:hypothetical protein
MQKREQQVGGRERRRRWRKGISARKACCAAWKLIGNVTTAKSVIIPVFMENSCL